MFAKTSNGRKGHKFSPNENGHIHPSSAKKLAFAVRNETPWIGYGPLEPVMKSALSVSIVLATHFLAGCSGPPPRPKPPTSVVAVEHFPDGSIRLRVEKSRNEDGRFVEHGASTSFHADGSKAEEGRYEMGVQVGAWVSWRADGSKAWEATFVDGVFSGPFTSFHKNDEPRRRCSWIAGKIHGKFETFYENGAPNECGTYVDGKRHGPWIAKYDNGHTKEEGEFEHDRRIGVWTRYHENGNKAGRGRYDGRQPTGMWSLWDTKGKLMTDSFDASRIR